VSGDRQGFDSSGVLGPRRLKTTTTMTNETNEEVDEEQAEEQDEEDVVIQRTGTELARPAYATHGYNPARDDMFGR